MSENSMLDHLASTNLIFLRNKLIHLMKLLHCCDSCMGAFNYRTRKYGSPEDPSPLMKNENFTRTPSQASACTRFTEYETVYFCKPLNEQRFCGNKRIPVCKN